MFWAVECVLLFQYNKRDCNKCMKMEHVFLLKLHMKKKTILSLHSIKTESPLTYILL